jgi:hypothetical protein
VTANALYPGFVAAGFGGANGWRGRLLQLLARWFAISPEEGAQTIHLPGDRSRGGEDQRQVFR